MIEIVFIQNDNYRNMSTIQPIKTIDIGGDLQLLCDSHVMQSGKNVQFQVHQPIPQEISLTFDKPWEGNTSTYCTIIQDEKDPDNRLRMYYRGSDYDPYTKNNNGYRTCLAYSYDQGLTWERPVLNLYEYEGSTENNIVWDNKKGGENFAPFIDTNPDSKYRYRAVGFEPAVYNFYCFVSEDGIHWDFLRPEPILTFYHGKFDTQNIAFWDPNRNEYLLYFRDYINKHTNLGRGIKIASSRDFIHWKGFQWLQYNDNYRQEYLQIYTNSIQPYYRSQKRLIGFPNRFHETRATNPKHPIKGLFDAIFMTSLNGTHWTRYQEGFVNPGPQPNKWASRNNILVHGLVETPSKLPESPNEISIYHTEGYYLDKCSLRRYTLRIDGFVSLYAPFTGGYFTTKPFVLTQPTLKVNFSTSAFGQLQVEILDANTKKPIGPFQAKTCFDLFGDEIEKEVRWFEEFEIKRFNQPFKHRMTHRSFQTILGQTVQLRFYLKDCHLYSFQFCPDTHEYQNIPKQLQSTTQQTTQQTTQTTQQTTQTPQQTTQQQTTQQKTDSK